MENLFNQIMDIEKIIVKDSNNKIVVMDRLEYYNSALSNENPNIEYKNYFKFNENDKIKQYYCKLSNAIIIDGIIENKNETFKILTNFLLQNNSYDYIIQWYYDNENPELSQLSLIFKNDFLY